MPFCLSNNWFRKTGCPAANSCSIKRLTVTQRCGGGGGVNVGIESEIVLESRSIAAYSENWERITRLSCHKYKRRRARSASAVSCCSVCIHMSFQYNCLLTLIFLSLVLSAAYQGSRPIFLISASGDVTDPEHRACEHYKLFGLWEDKCMTCSQFFPNGASGETCGS